MSRPTEQELKEFTNALQLSIKTRISDVFLEGDNVIIKLNSEPGPDDSHFYNVLRLFEGERQGEQKKYIVHDVDKVNWPKITLFLLLTRMNEDNILKLTEIDQSMEEMTKRLGFKFSDASVNSVGACSRRIFEMLEKKKMTLRELSEKTGLTQVSISNFKAGKDIKLSNLIKITAALGIKLKIT